MSRRGERGRRPTLPGGAAATCWKAGRAGRPPMDLRSPSCGPRRSRHPCGSAAGPTPPCDAPPVFADGWLGAFVDADGIPRQPGAARRARPRGGPRRRPRGSASASFINVCDDIVRGREEAGEYFGGLYRLPLERVERYCLIGPSEHVVEGLIRYVEAGVSLFTLVAVAPRPFAQYEALAGVRVALLGAVGAVPLELRRLARMLGVSGRDRSVHRDAAVDAERLPGHVTGGGRGEVGDRGGDVLGLAEGADRDRLDEALAQARAPVEDRPRGGRCRSGPGR